MFKTLMSCMTKCVMSSPMMYLPLVRRTLVTELHPSLCGASWMWDNSNILLSVLLEEVSLYAADGGSITAIVIRWMCVGSVVRGVLCRCYSPRGFIVNIILVKRVMVLYKDTWWWTCCLATALLKCEAWAFFPVSLRYSLHFLNFS